MSEVVHARNESSAAGYALGYSLGVAGFDPAQPVTLTDLMKRADAAMYEQKQRRSPSRGDDGGESSEPER